MIYYSRNGVVYGKYISCYRRIGIRIGYKISNSRNIVIYGDYKSCYKWSGLVCG
jgi:hypothetical protein